MSQPIADYYAKEMKEEWRDTAALVFDTAGCEAASIHVYGDATYYRFFTRRSDRGFVCSKSRKANSKILAASPRPLVQFFSGWSARRGMPIKSAPNLVCPTTLSGWPTSMKHSWFSATRRTHDRYGQDDGTTAKRGAAMLTRWSKFDAVGAALGQPSSNIRYSYLEFT